jgi:beta-N-acetylhexosaminidase
VQHKLNLGLAAALLAVATVVLFYALQWRSPLFASVRGSALMVLIALPLCVLAIEWVFWRTGMRSRALAILSAAGAMVALGALATTTILEARFWWIRYQVLQADPARLEKLGRHFIVGYRGIDELRGLIERRAIAGVFVTARNVWDMDADAVRREIDGLQAIRTRQGLPPLLIATDHEGGIVSRMSPPLASPPALGEIVRSHADEAERLVAVRQFAVKQGRALARLGINLNFAPVVDLNHGLVNPADRYTRIRDRAIARDPRVVTVVAGAYCTALQEAGVHCTLKHFPGLGRVYEDTHMEDASLTASAATLAESDWVPFRTLMHHAGAFTMLGHARLAAIDRDRPASFSKPVVSGLLRGQWQHDGVLVTDDFSMEAAYGADGGIAGASVAALNAGVDLILVSYDPDQFYPAMYAALQADAQGRLRQELLDRSDRRLAGATTFAQRAEPPPH